MASFAKNIDPEVAIMEIEKIENLYGKITAETVLRHAENKDCILHKLFEWDDSKAAEKFRLSQARTLINNIEVRIVSDGESISIPVYEVVRCDDGSKYKNVEVLTWDEIEYIKDLTMKSINNLRMKLSAYKQFDKVVKLLDAAVSELDLGM